MFRHLKQVNMSYFEHLKTSLGFSYHLFGGSIKAFIHGVLPNYYETSTSDLIKNMHSQLKKI